MAIWIITFEIITFCFFILAIILALKNKSYRSLSTIIAGAIFGVILEYVNIFLTEGYKYSQDFIFQVGREPFNVPIMIGLAWGLLLESSHKISESFHFPIILRTIFEATFVVSVDLFSDIVAVRLDGGFWIWAGHTIDTTITNTNFMGIAYHNFYGWYFVVFLSSLILHLFDAKYDKSTLTVLIIRALVCIIGSEILLVLVLLLASFLPNWLWLLFLVIYLGSIIFIVVYSVKNKIRPIKRIPNYFPLVYFIFLYLYNVFAMVYLGLAVQIPLYFGLILLYTLWVSIFLIKLTWLKEIPGEKPIKED